MRGTRPEPRWRRLARYGAAFLSFAIVAAVLFVWSGVYNVAASSDHWAVTTWLLERVRVHSVDTWSSFVEAPPPLEDPELIRLGAAHFEGGCTPCHSRPGDPANAIAAAMLPPPPPLGESVAHLAPEKIFWIVKHGLKYTAMPAWPSQERDDEVWAVTAFLAQLEQVSSRQYRELSGAVRVRAPESGGELAASSESVSLTECVRCHGDASTPPLSTLVPRLNGQPQRYLERALDEYAAATRQSGIMQPVSDLLTRDERRRIAGWYAGLEAPPGEPQAAPARLMSGRELVRRGDAEQGIPPCLACHSDRHPDSFPSLAGQNARYLATQLAAFKRGARDGSVYGQIMTVIARRLDVQQAEDAALYFASLAPGDAASLTEPSP